MVNNKKNSSMGCGAGILGTIMVLLGVVIHAVISSLIAKAFIHSRFGNDAACAILTLTTTNILVAFILYEAIFIIWQIRASQRLKDKHNMVIGEKTQVDKIVLWVLIACVSLSLVFSVVNANTFTELREDSISKVCFVTTKEYRWDERNYVLRYSFSCDDVGGLSFKVIMKDEEVVDILGGVTSLSDSFREKYGTDKVDLLAYVADLSDQFDDSVHDIEKIVSTTSIENARSHYEGKEESALIWEHIQRIIE